MASTRLTATFLLMALVPQPSLAQSPDDTLDRLREGQRWFEMREAVELPAPPLFYRCLVASAFNDSDEATRCFTRVIRRPSDAKNAREARELLGTLYLRLGRAADARRIFDALANSAPQREDWQNIRSLLAAVSPVRNQRVRSSKPSRFSCGVSQTGVRLPVSINGRPPVTWLLDTAFTMPALSQREAEMLGLVVRGQSGRAVDSAGGSTTVRVTRADRVTIGHTEVRDVLMLVFPDSQQPWSELAPGQRGIVGLPLALALERISWASRGSCETGGVHRTSSASVAPNVAFNGLEPVVRVGFAGRTLEMQLDTGNQVASQLWERFARDFSAVLEQQGTRGTVRVNQIGGSNERPVIVLPEIQLEVGGLATQLKPANVYSRPVGDERLHGNLGMDVLRQAAEVTLDFRSMRLTLH